MAIRTALVVDDSKVARLTLTKLLKSRGISVDTASSGPAALEYLQTSQPDVVFMDYMMPDMNGLEATQAITANPDTASIPVVFCTGNDTPEDRDQARAHGATEYLTKGHSEEQIDAILSAVAEAAAVVATTPAANEPEVDPESLNPESLNKEIEGLVERAVAEAKAAAEGAANGLAEGLRAELQPRFAELEAQLSTAQAGNDATAVSARVDELRTEFQARLDAIEEAATATAEGAKHEALQGVEEIARNLVTERINELREALRTDIAAAEARAGQLAGQAIAQAATEAGTLRGELVETTATLARAQVAESMEQERVRFAEFAERAAAEKANVVAEKVVEETAARLVEEKAREAARAAAEEVTFSTVETAREVSMEEMSEFRTALLETLDRRVDELLSGETLRETVSQIARTEADKVASEAAERSAEHTAKKLVNDAVAKQATLAEARANGLYRRTVIVCVLVLASAVAGAVGVHFAF